jgi:hypothetical protein
VYEHYDVSVERDNSSQQITYVFKCKYSEETHETHRRLWTKTGNGTTDMQKSVTECDATHGVTATSLTSSMGTYTPGTHHVIIAMKSATSNRPFNAVRDKYYRMEVEMLRPGTKIPHVTTVSLDIKLLYVELSKTVCDYFKVSVVIVVSCSSSNYKSDSCSGSPLRH